MAKPSTRAEAGSILVVDDEPGVVKYLARILSDAGHHVVSAGDAESALALLAEGTFQLVFLDNQMPGQSGLDALTVIKERSPSVEVVMMTAQGSIAIAVEAMKRGAFEFLEKPFEEKEHITLAASRALERGWLRSRNAELTSRLEGRAERLIGNSPAIRAVNATIADLARSDASVLIEGESGTGKEVLAHAIHDASPRAAKPFIAVNCGAIPETMMESELFGHEKGAFTGAVAASRGLFRAAEGGTIFLDEIGELPLAMQVKLLRALQAHEVRPVGSTVSHKFDARVTAATNRNLRERTASGEFREDLFYRVAVLPVLLPPLRERREDIPVLTRHFVRALNADEPKFDEIDPAVMDLLSAWSWPGNVRELENVVERAFALGKRGRFSVEHLPPELTGQPRPQSSRPEELEAVPLSLEAFEKYALERALRESGGDASRAAGLLDLPRSTFYRYLQRHGLKQASGK